jgi:hypothetical protein
MDEIDGVVRRMDTDKAHAGGDGGFFADDGERACGDLLGGFESRGGGSAKAELELAGVDLREDLRADEGNDDADGEDDAAEIGGDEDVACGEEGRKSQRSADSLAGLGLSDSFRLLCHQMLRMGTSVLESR